MGNFNVFGSTKPYQDLNIIRAKELELEFGQSKVLISSSKIDDKSVQSVQPSTKNTLKPLDRATITIGNDPDPDYQTAFIQTLQGKAFLGRVFSLDSLVAFVRTYVREKNKGKALKYLQIEGHGRLDGRIKFSDHDKVYIHKVISALFKNNLIKKGSTVEFFCCLLGQSFEYVKSIAKKYGIIIKAANYVQTTYGVNGYDADKVEKDLRGLVEPGLRGDVKVRVPTNKQIILFKDGKAFGQDGKEIYKIDYKN